MGEIDITQKMFVDYADVFADICNVLMFNGEQVIYPEFLKETGRTSQYKADDGSIHQEDRDACKYWQRGNVRISLVGLENQVNRIDYMPHRIIGYDGASYRSQILGEKPYELYPVITLVLYFGFTRWGKPLSIFDEMDVSDNIRPFVNDYKVNLFEIAFLKPEQVQMFKSDFREVADYFVQKRMNKKYRPSKRTITHVDEFLKFMAAMSGEDRFVSVRIPQEKGVVSMCDVIEGFVQQGKVEGKAEGAAEDFVRCVEGLMANNSITASEACEMMGRSLNEYEEAKNLLLVEA